MFFLQNKVINISQELQYAKEELFQRIYSCPHGKEGCFLEVEDTVGIMVLWAGNGQR